jgi:hypothetical protein
MQSSGWIERLRHRNEPCVLPGDFNAVSGASVLVELLRDSLEKTAA